jgi:hypothetical protein
MVESTTVGPFVTIFAAIVDTRWRARPMTILCQQRLRVPCKPRQFSTPQHLIRKVQHAQSLLLEREKVVVIPEPTICTSIF